MDSDFNFMNHNITPPAATIHQTHYADNGTTNPSNHLNHVHVVAEPVPAGLHGLQACEL
jgi:hypothetical protein